MTTTPTEIIDNSSWMISSKATNPVTLKWVSLFGILKNYQRLRLNITSNNASKEVLSALQNCELPDKEIPEIQGLIKALKIACARARIKSVIEKGPKELREGMVACLEPYIIKWDFQHARLSLVIAPGEIQIILRKAGREKSPFSDRLNMFKKECLGEVRDWLRRGNR